MKTIKTFALVLALAAFPLTAHAEEALPWLTEGSQATSQIFVLNYEVDAFNFNDEDETTLDKVVAELKDNKDKRATIKAYATNDDSKFNEGRRLSLKRALEVRKELIGAGVDVRRLVVKALGIDTITPENSDRVDIVIQ